jgi:hypothetical protein
MNFTHQTAIRKLYEPDKLYQDSMNGFVRLQQALIKPFG